MRDTVRGISYTALCIVGVFFITNWALKVFNADFDFTFYHSLAVFAILFGIRFVLSFVTSGIIGTQSELNRLENENTMLLAINRGTMHILSAVIRQHGGELRIPFEVMMEASEDDQVHHFSDFKKEEEVFSLVEKGEKKDA